jgi:drug/metabolite transporter (DMT)-like permease
VNRSTFGILLLAQLCFASLPVAGRFAYGQLDLPPDAVVISRMVFGCLIFSAWARLSGNAVRVERRDWRLIIVCGLLGAVLNQTFFLHGLAHLPPAGAATSASLMGSTSPVFAGIFAVALGREPFRPTRAIGIALALAGALALVDFSRLSLGGASWIGNLMILGNSAAYGLFLVLARGLRKFPPLQLVGLLFLVGTICTAPFGVHAFIDYAPRMSWAAARVLAFIVLVPTLMAYGLTQIGLARAEATAVATFIYLQPMLAALGAYLVLGERPGRMIVVAAILIFSGVFVSTRPVKARGGGAVAGPRR